MMLQRCTRFFEEARPPHASEAFISTGARSVPAETATFRSAGRLLWLAALLACLWSPFAMFAAMPAAVTLAWDPVVAPNLSTYYVYYGTASRVYTSKLAVGNAPTATLTGLNPGTTYFLAVTSADPSGAESDFSPEVMFTVPAFVLPAKGSYAGLFSDTNGVSYGNSGFFAAALSSQGSFSARMSLAGKTYALAGRFSGGVFSNSIPRRGQSPLSVQLQLSLGGGEVMAGHISDGAWTAELVANRAVFSMTSLAPQAGRKYTLVIPGSQDSSLQPGGNGFGTLSLDALGNVTFSGALGDGTKVIQRAFVSRRAQWPLYLSLYSGHGCMLGWLTLTNLPDSDINGQVSWIKLPVPGSRYYPAGFTLTNGPDVIGSAYSPAYGAPLASWPNGGMVILENGKQSITNRWSVDARNRVSGANSLSMVMIPSSGLFRGRVLDPNGKAVPLNGVLLQKQNAGYGYFLGTSQSGSVYFGP